MTTSIGLANDLEGQQQRWLRPGRAAGASVSRPHNGVPWTAIPLGLGLAVYPHWLEVPGMGLAFRGNQVSETAYP